MSDWTRSGLTERRRTAYRNWFACPDMPSILEIIGRDGLGSPNGYGCDHGPMTVAL